jgi:hypothetical protein
MRIVVALMLVSSAVLVGCPKDSGVLLLKESNSLFDETTCKSTTSKLGENEANGEVYRIYQQAATGFVPLSAVREDIEQQAVGFCDNNGKQIKKLQIVNSPMGLGCTAKAELIFTCVAKEKPEPQEDRLYVQLRNLKKLLDDGLLTNAEFEQQKAKLLNTK